MHTVEILSGVVGLLLGCLIGIWLERRKQPDVDALKAEHANYRRDVENHFEKTAQLAHQMADNYRNMYQHLAQGAVSLCEQKDELQAPSLTAMRKHIEADKKRHKESNEAADVVATEQESTSTEAAASEVPGLKPVKPTAD